MKKIFCIALMALVAGATTEVNAQQKVCRGQTPIITVGGYINSSTLGSGKAKDSANANWNSASFPLYSKVDTFTGSGADTFKFRVVGDYNSVYSWVNVTSIAGTNTSVVVKLWGSGDGLFYSPLYTNTVSATGNPYGYIVNNGWGNPYSHYMWTTGSGATQTSSWNASLRVR
jgi:hypothetical protein